MLKSEIFNVNFSENLTKADIENFFKQKNIDTVKWAVVRVSDESAEVLAAYEKKF